MSKLALEIMIKVIIGLGNPGLKFVKTRHNIGFRVLDELAKRANSTWREGRNELVADATFAGNSVLLVKPQTFMNSSGQVMPPLKKSGIKSENLLVVHDELEKTFGKLGIKVGGSARGHNGLKSIIEQVGPDFARLWFGIGRPEDREEVPSYVLGRFEQDEASVEEAIGRAADMAIEAIESTDE